MPSPNWKKNLFICILQDGFPKQKLHLGEMVHSEMTTRVVFTTHKVVVKD